MPNRVIETEGLSKSFGPNVAVADLTLSIERGEVFGFLGPNGAGKTPSLKLLLGLVVPSGGRGAVLGKPLGLPAARERIGFLPEHFRFHDCLTARELLWVHGRLYGMKGARLAARIDELLLRVDLVAAAERPLRTYSKGMLQRAGLAQALLNAPELVFLDEPTSGLDPLGRVLVRDIIEELRSEGTTVFLNSHLLGDVEAICDRVAFVKQGRVVRELALAEAGELLEVELRIASSGDSLLTGLRSFGSELWCEGERYRMRIRDEATLPELARWVVAQGAALYELRCRRKTLEEWFVEIMGDDQGPG